VKILSIDITLEGTNFAEDTGKVFDGMTISPCAEGWRVIIRANDKDGTGIYAMGTGELPVTVYKELYSALCGKGGDYLWRFDKWRND